MNLKVGDKVKIKTAENSGFGDSSIERRRIYFGKTTYISKIPSISGCYLLNISGESLLWSQKRFDKVEN